MSSRSTSPVLKFPLSRRLGAIGENVGLCGYTIYIYICVCVQYIVYNGRKFRAIYALCDNVCMLCHSHTVAVLSYLDRSQLAVRNSGC